VKEDFLNDELDRAGFAESGVSRHNRLVDRHSAVYGYYWKSYDFGNSEGQANLFKNPLGPVVKDDERFAAFTNHAFEHAGGEMIFSLPNGLQGYYLSEADGDRIDAGPTEIVRDLKEIGGTPAVLNGLSCMHCHKHGTIRFEDTVREGMALAGEPRDKAERLFATQEEWNRILDKDEARFMEALQQATAEFLLVGEDAGRELREMREPVGEIAKLYQKDVELEEAAVELGFDDPKALLTVLNANPNLCRRLGLGPLVNGNAIKRSAWSNLDEFLSPFQRTASELDRGTAHVGF
ncbi:MAG: transcriptional regulator, partial [Planctomycetaceae bacterium]